MLNVQKARTTIDAAAALAHVNYTPAGNQRTKLGRVGQNQLQAIKAGREAVKRLQELKAAMEQEVARAEALVIEALKEGAPVANGLITPSVEEKTRFARISWKGATERLCKRFGIPFTAEHEALKAEYAKQNEVYEVLKLSA